MTQPELFKTVYAPVTGGAIFEPNIRLASGQQTHPANNFSGPPMPAPASTLKHDPLPPFARNSETSRQAAIAKYNAGTGKSQREMIYRWIKFRGDTGATREEIQEHLELSGDTVRPRVCELLGAAKGHTVPKIRLSGETRKTKSGIKAEVLVCL
jgi:hypothetical protein